jgi:hypothetical protein
VAATVGSLRWIIRWAYGLRDYQVIGLPGWADRQRFEIRATYSPASADAATVRTMLQRLLADLIRHLKVTGFEAEEAVMLERRTVPDRRYLEGRIAWRRSLSSAGRG